MVNHRRWLGKISLGSLPLYESKVREYLVALGLVIIALQDRCYPEWIPAAS